MKIKNPFSADARFERQAKKRIQRDPITGLPIRCDCPDAQQGPCDGKGWCER
jgi:hypothetical protein